MTLSCKALLFDLDGTLVDSSEVVLRVMEAWCLRNSVPFQSVLDVYQGGRTEDTVKLVALHLCARSEALEIERLEAAALDGLLPIPGACRLLNELESHMWAIVTSCSMLAAQEKLKVCEMPTPSVFITAESVSHGKPHPEPFLKAASELDVKPEECLVFEDADNGVNSALAAGCSVVVVGSSCQIEHAGIVSRIASFVDVEVTKEGNLKIGGDIIELVRSDTEYRAGDY